ncbi:SAM-dependent methyltransferase [Plantactinospora sp. S1510]|uniref:SAM-dependent methyltransferase n=1 Tax=Plantactinospora alkalitolerans TaxID=2789879 RepID=A0ABS0GUE4_9ACTN|nr:SAM-dependent methyltransferase [Plantactinospora alkalitolerans]MBF9129829.1 SAM-dependent methyltransferase [Plantactinospora alkalitolerans]
MPTEMISFLAQLARSPRAVGAIAPSGVPLAERITATIPRTGGPLVVELGPGTGAFTRVIQRRLAGQGRHLALEINATFADRLAREHPGVDVLQADAGNLADLLTERNLPRAEAIVSGLPWAVFTAQRQREILSAVVAALADDGAFTTFAYQHARWAPPARRLHRTLRELFEEVVVGGTVWANLPPAVVYHCRRPVRQPLVAEAGTSRSARRPSPVRPLGMPQPAQS